MRQWIALSPKSFFGERERIRREQRKEGEKPEGIQSACLLGCTAPSNRNFCYSPPSRKCQSQFEPRFFEKVTSKNKEREGLPHWNRRARRHWEPRPWLSLHILLQDQCTSHYLENACSNSAQDLSTPWQWMVSKRNFNPLEQGTWYKFGLIERAVS